MSGSQPWAYFLPTSEAQARIKNVRVSVYFLLTLGLGLFFVLTRKFAWSGNTEIHTLMETVAVLLAVVVGGLALIKYYTLPTRLLLFLGAGFIGTAILDGYHAFISSDIFIGQIPTDADTLIPWSWFASRTFLSIFLFLNFSLLLLEKRKGKQWDIKPLQVYFWIGLTTLATFIFFAYTPLPSAYFLNGVVERPEEYISGVFFLLGFVLCIKYRAWEKSSLYHWVALGLILNFMAELLFMPNSQELFDFDFEVAHLLKIMSYFAILVGLGINTYEQFNLIKRDDQLQKTIRNTMVDGLFMIDARGIIQTVNKSGLQIFGYSEEELIGNNVNMLMGDVDAPRHDGYIHNFLKTGDPKIIGLPPREVIGKTKDGRTIELELAVGSLQVGREKFFIGTLRDVTEKKRMLRESFEELEQFAYVASHDLKTPLQGIKNLSSWIQKDLGDTLTGEPAENMKLLRERVKRMETLLDDILTYSRASRPNLKPERINLNKVIKDLVDLLNIPKGFKIKITDKLPSLMAPKSTFEQIFSNLINNAIKHHDRNSGTITISSKDAGEFCEISVADDGPGIAPKYQDRIFKMFQTLESRDDVEGSGLGLSIVKRLVTNQGGEITVRSEKGQRGATFSFSWKKNENKDRKT